jgi:hypothetical protein
MFVNCIECHDNVKFHRAPKTFGLDPQQWELRDEHRATVGYATDKRFVELLKNISSADLSDLTLSPVTAELETSLQQTKESVWK